MFNKTELIQQLVDLKVLDQKIRHGVHLGIFVEPYLSYILNGSKTVESRFTQNRQPPYRKVFINDVILLKEASGGIIGKATAQKVWSYNLTETSDVTVASIREEMNDEILADKEFWEEKANAKFVTLIKLTDVYKFDNPIKIKKEDRRTWVVLKYRIGW